ncbi:MAG TPA: ATP-binding protein, partial [Myxococcota bacterium]|nr:ATP-binding protein [Myxococcota bacterium]
NPALLGEDAVGLGRSLRRPLAERLLGLLARLGDDGAPQHQLVLGARGSGKTMLLRTLRQAILDEPKLARRWLPLTFPEAQWDVTRPSDLWENALDYLMVALERADPARGPAESRRIAAAIAALPDDEDARQKASLALLIGESERLGRRFVLLVDTLDVVLDRLKKDQWHIREVLSAEPRLLLIGTSARAIEATYRYDAAFYDFFQLHELRPLLRPGLIEAIARLEGGPLRAALLAFAEVAPAELEACLDMLGTQPRTLALIARAFERTQPGVGLAGRVVLLVLDALTPSMMARMEALAPQSQTVVHALATLWHPARPQEVAQRTRLSPNVVSAQLHRLVQEGIVEKVPYPPGARQGVILSDRLMSVWLLMRLGQPHRRRLVAACAGLALVHGGSEAELSDELSALDPADRFARIAPELVKLVESRRFPYTAPRND